ncbi:hypothetical protein FGO68_gene8838 [Halteria grandinella]|uniref:Uncharacterized protein n=1 Tax=Halteria grandinella TaxID=5974 RepID=A0A8J8NE45_HALGN|nr:hypothetical protein FGO68_gene8838 [Halteria grandinella]
MCPYSLWETRKARFSNFSHWAGMCLVGTVASELAAPEEEVPWGEQFAWTELGELVLSLLLDSLIIQMIKLVLKLNYQ